jgi:hypothetical protein
MRHRVRQEVFETKSRGHRFGIDQEISQEAIARRSAIVRN